MSTELPSRIVHGGAQRPQEVGLDAQKVLLGVWRRRKLCLAAELPAFAWTYTGLHDEGAQLASPYSWRWRSSSAASAQPGTRSVPAASLAPWRRSNASRGRLSLSPASPTWVGRRGRGTAATGGSTPMATRGRPRPPPSRHAPARRASTSSTSTRGSRPRPSTDGRLRDVGGLAEHAQRLGTQQPQFR